MLTTGALMMTSAAGAETFEQVLEKMAGAHPRIVAAQQTTRAGRADVRAAKSSYRPQFGVETDIGWDDGNSTRPSGFALLPEAKISQLVFDGGRTPAEIRRRKLRVDLLGVQEQAALAELSQQLGLAWIDHARAAELIAISQQQVAALRTLDQLVVDIASYDRGRTSDVVMVESRLEQAETALQTRQIALIEAQGRIREVAAFPVEPQGSPPDLGGALPDSPESAERLALASPASRIAEIEVAEGKESVRGTRNWWVPQLALEGARTSERTVDGDTRLLNGFAFRVRASALPFDSGGGRARHESAKASLQSAQASADLTRTSLSAQVRRLWTFQAQRSARLPSLEGLISRADDARNIVFEQFRLGRRTILDLLGYELERFNVRAQLVNERFDIAQTRYQLMGLLGRIYPAIVDGNRQ
ncbi:TolC family protein [Sphingobium bisphenolivorans]|uniref:TolC family protein n=1 Tax=Sphingobium bisphenolivorans TaxID=1335760 RepID=UPI00039A531C|nr:TolC family protein [Sphingobium bisphenolivorans]